MWQCRSSRTPLLHVRAQLLQALVLARIWTSRQRLINVIATTTNWSMDQHHSDPGPEIADPSQSMTSILSPLACCRFRIIGAISCSSSATIRQDGERLVSPAVPPPEPRREFLQACSAQSVIARHVPTRPLGWLCGPLLSSSGAARSRSTAGCCSPYRMPDIQRGYARLYHQRGHSAFVHGVAQPAGEVAFEDAPRNVDAVEDQPPGHLTRDCRNGRSTSLPTSGTSRNRVRNPKSGCRSVWSGVVERKITRGRHSSQRGHPRMASGWRRWSLRPGVRQHLGCAVVEPNAQLRGPESPPAVALS